jgi:hypothetical protein
LARASLASKMSSAEHGPLFSAEAAVVGGQKNREADIEFGVAFTSVIMPAMGTFGPRSWPRGSLTIK